MSDTDHESNRDNPSFSSINLRWMDVMSIGEFRQCVLNGAFINDDGHGCWATADKVSNVRILPSDMLNGAQPPEWASQVVWFNK